MPLLFNRGTLILFVLSTAVLFNFIIPPFQNPDEPPHLGFILSHAYGQEKAKVLEKEIIEFMDKNDWWHFVGLGRPEALPTELSQTDFIGILSREVVTSYSVELYHLLLGKTVGLFVKKDVRLFYYLCRFLSYLLYLGSIILVFASFSRLSNFGLRYLILAAPLALFLPQSAIGHFSVNPDSLSTFVGCSFFFVAVSLFIDRFDLRTFTVLVLISGFGFFTDRAVFSLIVLLFILPFFFWKFINRGKNIARPVVIIWIAILCVSWLTWFFPMPVFNSLGSIQSNFLRRLPYIAGLFSLNAHNRQFFSILFESFFLRFGWMSYAAEGLVYIILKLLLFASFSGILVYFGRVARSKFSKSPRSHLKTKSDKLMLFFSTAFLFQLFLNWIVWASKYAQAQGRYMFPVIIPALTLFAVGVQSLFSLVHKKAGKAVLSALVVAEFLFFSYAVWNYILPVFHLTRRSPFPGL